MHSRNLCKTSNHSMEHITHSRNSQTVCQNGMHSNTYACELYSTSAGAHSIVQALVLSNNKCTQVHSP